MTYEIFLSRHPAALNRLEITDSLKSLVWVDTIGITGVNKHREAVEAYIKQEQDDGIILAPFTIYAVEGVSGDKLTDIKFFVHAYNRWGFELFDGLARHADAAHAAR